MHSMTERLIADRYRLIEPIAAGGFGEVWKALDSELGIVVALKRVRLAADAGDAERAKAADAARAEARHAAGLAFHPHIVAVTNVAVDADGLPWLAMRYIEGPSLATALEAGPLPPQQVERVAAALLSALDAAHRAGIVHRDVKPGNVMLDAQGGVFLTDFGIAKRQDGTVTNAFTGSVGYAAPERFHHKAFGPPNGPAGDLFSVGATLYHAIEGRQPFDPNPADSSVGAVLHAVCYEPHPPLTRAGNLAPLIDALLAKKAAERPTVEAAQAMLADPGAEVRSATGGRASWQSTNMADGAAVSPAPTVTASAVLPKTQTSDTAVVKTGRTRPDQRWFMVGAPLLVLVALLAVTLPGIMLSTRTDDPKSGTDNYHHSWSIYRIFVPDEIHFGRPGSDAFLILVAALLVTAAATVRLRQLGRFNAVLRLAGYIALPGGTATLVALVHHDYQLVFTSVHSSQTYDDGTTYSSTHSVGVGLWLLYLTFIALYGLFIWREVMARRQKGK
jgi:Protein kinase domain